MKKVNKLISGCFPHIDGYLPSQVQNPKNREDEWDFVPEDTFKDILKNLQGQHYNTGLGIEIFNTIQDSNGPRKWIEVGAWNGRGTTSNLLTGAMKRENKEGIEILSYEADPFMYKIAKENLEFHPFYEQFFYLVNGRIPCHFEFPSEELIPKVEKEGVNGHFCLQYEREKAIYMKSKEIKPYFNPEAIILDGGEYTGYFDWLGIEKRNLRYVFLDDVNTFKHKKVYEELLGNTEWSLVKENRNELNGWAVFRKI